MCEAIVHPLHKGSLLAMGRKMGMEIDYRRFGITFTPSDLEALLQDHYTFFTKVPVCVCKIWARFSHGERIYGPHKRLTLSSAMTQSFDKANCTLHTTYQEELCRWSMSRNRPRGAIKIPQTGQTDHYRAPTVQGLTYRHILQTPLLLCL